MNFSHLVTAVVLCGCVACSHGTNRSSFRNVWHDQGVKSAVRLQLMRDDRVQARHVRVAVRDGHVTLSGHVRSAAESQRAATNAGRAGGVVAVANHIQVMDRSAAPVRQILPSLFRGKRAEKEGRAPVLTAARNSTAIERTRTVQESDFDNSLITSPKQEGRKGAPVPSVSVPVPTLPSATPTKVKPTTPKVPTVETPGPKLPPVRRDSSMSQAEPTVKPLPRTAPVIQAPSMADGGYIDRGMLPPAQTVGAKPTAEVVAPAWVKRDSAPAVTPQAPAVAAPHVAPRTAPAGHDDSLAQEAAAELQRLKQGH